MQKKNISVFSEGPWFVYIILCDNDSLYTGITKDIERRFKEHSKGKGAKYTRMHKPVYIVHAEEYENHSLAIKREIEIKSYPTNKKRKLHNKDIGVFYEKNSSHFNDLSWKYDFYKCCTKL